MTKCLRNLQLTLVLYTSASQSKVRISQNFVAFSEYMNFTMRICSVFPSLFAELSNRTNAEKLYKRLSYYKGGLSHPQKNNYLVENYSI